KRLRPRAAFTSPKIGLQRCIPRVNAPYLRLLRIREAGTAGVRIMKARSLRRTLAINLLPRRARPTDHARPGSQGRCRWWQGDAENCGRRLDHGAQGWRYSG